MSETLTPTSHTVADPTVNNPANAYDGDTATFAQLQEGTNPLFAELVLYDFPAGSISPTARDTVTLEVSGRWASGDTDDTFTVWFSADASEAFTKVAEYNAGDGFPTTPSAAGTIQVDITSLAGQYAATGFQVALRFWNGPGVSPPAPPRV